MSCKKSAEGQGLATDQIALAATEALNGLVQSQELVADLWVPNNQPDVWSFVKSFIIEPVWAASCTASGGTSTTSCASPAPFLKTKTYNCSFGTATTSGTTTITYSNSGCTLGINGTALREPNLTMRTATGILIATKSASHTDYRGNVISGGQKTTKAGSTRTYDVLGLQRVVSTSDSRLIVDLSSRSTSAFTVTGTTMADITLTSGNLEVTNNVIKYVSTWTAVSLRWSATCSCPISGSLEGVFEGQVTGSGTITYTSSCGTMTLLFGGVTTNITLDACGTI